MQYIIGHYVENSDAIRVDDLPGFKKLAKSLIKKLINDERMLMIHEAHDSDELRRIGLHPNYHSS